LQKIRLGGCRAVIADFKNARHGWTRISRKSSPV
jgi:hypothetical protein